MKVERQDIIKLILGSYEAARLLETLRDWKELADKDPDEYVRSTDQCIVIDSLITELERSEI